MLLLNYKLIKNTFLREKYIYLDYLFIKSIFVCKQLCFSCFISYKQCKQDVCFNWWRLLVRVRLVSLTAFILPQTSPNVIYGYMQNAFVHL